jgi:hypothetical protein
MIDNLSTKDLLKYLIIIGILYTILKTLPTQKLTNKDIILLVVIILIIFIIIDYKCFKTSTELFADLKSQNNSPKILKVFNSKNNNTNKNNIINNSNNTNKNNVPRIIRTLTNAKNAPNALNVRNAPNAPNVRNATNAPNTPNATNAQPIVNNKVFEYTSKVDTINDSNFEIPGESIEGISGELSDEISEEMYEELSEEIYEETPEEMYEEIPEEIPEEMYEEIPEEMYEEIPEEIPKSNIKVPKEIPIHSVVKSKSSTKMTLPPVLGCTTEIDKIRKLMQGQIDDLKNKLSNNVTVNTGEKYFNYLLNELVSNNTLTDSEVQNIKNKINLKLLTFDEVITSLESLKGSKVNVQPNNDLKYNELPSGYFQPIGDKISNDWNNQDAILNTDRWSVPMPRPPVCINNSPCKICPNDLSYASNLKDWDDNLRITNTTLNKKWIGDKIIKS